MPNLIGGTSGQVIFDRVSQFAAWPASASPRKRTFDGRAGVNRHAGYVEIGCQAVIQLPNLELRIMRYELTDYEWTAIKPMLPNTISARI